MKVTIKELQEQIRHLEWQNGELRRENAALKALHDATKMQNLVAQTMMTSLEKVTECVAHVLSDLSGRRWEVKR